jgi:hypothetical protein
MSRRVLCCAEAIGLAVAGLLLPAALAQTGGATFGDVVRLGGTPSDVVLDETRGRLYLVRQAANRRRESAVSLK